MLRMHSALKLVMFGAVIGGACLPQTVDAALYWANAGGHGGAIRANMDTMVVAVGSQSQKASEDFINTMAGSAIEFLGDEDISAEQKKQEFSKLLSGSFDLSTIGRFALGRYWRTASPAQRDEYQALFKDMLIDVYSRRFGEYGGQQFEIVGSRSDNEKDVLVNSQIVSPDGHAPAIKVDWRVRHKNGKYQIIDVVVEGVSMALTQRSEFSSIIQRGGGNVSVLIDHLKK